MATAPEIEAKVVKLETNLDRLDTIINGSNTTTVTVDGAVIVPSVSKALKDSIQDPGDAAVASFEAAGAAKIVEVQGQVDEAIADVTVQRGLAQTAAQTAHDDSVLTTQERLLAQTAAANAQSSARSYATWTGGLASATSTIDGQGAEVLDSDTGTHLQATATGYDGASVPNAGRYSYNATWSRWVRIGTTGLSGKQTVEHIDTAETGWSYVISDAVDKISFGVDLYGKVWYAPHAELKLLESNMPDTFLARQFPVGITTSAGIPPESGFVFGWTDVVGNIAWGIKADGSFWTNFASDCVFPSGLMTSVSNTVLAVLLPASAHYVWWGDSLTAGSGGGGTTAPAVLQTALGQTVDNRGIGGQGSAAIATRQGGLKMLVSVTGDAIPASGAVTLTARSQTPITNQGSSSFTGTLVGVPGTLAASTADGGVTYTYTFTRTTAGSEVACPASSEFTFDFAEAGKDKTAIFFSGRNDAKNTRAAIVATRDNVLAMAKKLSPLSKRYLVLSVLNGDAEIIGTSSYNGTKALNAELLQTFGDRFVDVRRYLIDHGLEDAGITPTTQDNTDVAGDTIPSSLRSDSVHLTAAGYTLVGNFIARQIQARGW